MKFVIFLLLCLPSLSFADQDADFLAARESFRRGNALQVATFATKLKDSPLAIYLNYYQLRLNWDKAASTEIKKFLAQTDDSPVVEQFRVDWLKRLAYQQRWNEFASEFPSVQKVDTELACYGFQLRAKTDEMGALKEARSKWFSGTGLPQSCANLFLTGIKKGVITERDIWARLRLALEENNVALAKQLIEYFPQTRVAPLKELKLASTNPQAFLNILKLEKESQVNHAIALFALQQIAKQNPTLAFSEWKKIEAHFNDEERHYFFGQLGYRAAMLHESRALEWYKAADNAPLNEAQLAWRTRAALRALNWAEVSSSIAAMPAAQQQENAWRYWKGRALKATDNPKVAELLFLELSREYNFYGQLANEELANLPILTNTPINYQPSKEELASVAKLAFVQRTFALYRMDLRTEAAKEWSWGLRKLDDKQILAASELARNNQIYDRAIHAADRTQTLHDFNLRYPSPYRDSLQNHLRANSLDEAWVYGLIRQESRFITQAKSNVGAAGLMQVMPSTAKWIARRMGLRDYRKAQIHDTEVNLRLGTYYMKNVLSTFENSPVLASAAYNAGPSRARRWRGDIPLEGAIYAETIPFDETRDYVKKVMSNTLYYATVFGQPAIPLKKRLGVINPKTPENQRPLSDEK
jgi:soluble lytic murein transglycosylase